MMRTEGCGDPAAPSFTGAKAAAANIPQPGEQGNYTAELFWEDFPQFTRHVSPGEGEGELMRESLIPEKMLLQFIRQANDSVLPSRWGSIPCRRSWSA